ncbi:MAG TPA: hypothetical protein VGX76_14580, partial [Pirellulales bacterium]|nr:hypothetical protein [Pirellulales bacterium]
GWSPQNILAYLTQRGTHEADFVVLALPECDLTRPLHQLNDVFLFESSPTLRLTTLAKVEMQKFERNERVGRSTLDQNAADNVKAIEQIKRCCGSLPFVAAFVPSRNAGSTRWWPAFEAELPGAVDLRDELADPSCYFDDWHLTAKGHRVVGEKLYANLRDRLRDARRSPPADLP